MSRKWATWCAIRREGKFFIAPPSIVAFNVTPTSGAEPYTFSAEFLNKESFAYGYALNLYTSGVGATSCPSPDITTSPTGGASLLLRDGFFVREQSVDDLTCRTFKLVIVNQSNEVVDMQYVSISNL